MQLRGWWVRHCMAGLCACLWGAQAWAADVGLAGVIGSRALLVIDGAEAQPVGVGQSRGGVKVLAVEGSQVTVEIEGKKRVLRIGQNVSAAAGAAGGGEKAILNADGAGHFVTQGAINGAPVRFLVDTGATLVSMGASDARRIGIDVSKGERGMVQTANGVAPAYKVKLNSVKVGDVTLNNIDAMVHHTDLPVVLLGMSFLNRMEMVRDGSVMTLKKRY